MSSGVTVEDQDFMKFLQRLTTNSSSLLEEKQKKVPCEQTRVLLQTNDPVLDTKEGLKQMAELMVVKGDKLSKYPKVIQQSMFFQIEMGKLLDVFNSKQLGKNPFLQKTAMENMRLATGGIQDVIKLHDDQLVQMTDLLQLQVLEAEQELKVLQQYADTLDAYTQPIEDKYTVVEVANGDGHGGFSYSSRKQHGHSQSIEYRGHHIIKDDWDHLGRILVSKHQDTLYDMQVECKVLLGSEGLFSLVLRYRDPSNYYGVELLQREGQGFKRVVKMTNGKLTLLAEKKDGGFL